MSRLAQLAREAAESYRASRMAEASLQYRHAAQVALDQGSRSKWFEYIVWAAYSSYGLGDAQGCLNLLLAARVSEPDDAPLYVRWIAKKLYFDLTSTLNPTVARLSELLNELRSFSEAENCPAADLSTIEGEFKADRGELTSALQYFEVSWRDFDGQGYLHAVPALHAVECCLRLAKWNDADDWLNAVTRSEEFTAIWVVTVHAMYNWRLQLARQEATEKLLAQARRVVDLCSLQQSDAMQDMMREIIARTNLLALDQDDPATLIHPSRQELRRRLKNSRPIGRRYSARLLFVDYRLACLRYAAGILPVDDLFYTKPQLVPTNIKGSVDLVSRVAKARAAAQWAMSFARYVDGLFECEWRKQEVQTRIDRIEQIAAVI